jgi:hypothetical protein
VSSNRSTLPAVGERALQIERESAEKSDMPPILKRLRKPSQTKSPDLATLLQPYGTSEPEASEDPADAHASEPPAQDEDS